MSEIASMADSASRYSDLVVGFVVVQSITFLNALMREGRVLREVVRLRPRIVQGIVGCNSIYLLIILTLAILESYLRAQECDPWQIQLSLWVFFAGRIIIVVLSTGSCLFSIKEAVFPLPKLQEERWNDPKGKGFFSWLSSCLKRHN